MNKPACPKCGSEWIYNQFTMTGKKQRRDWEHLSGAITHRRFGKRAAILEYLFTLAAREGLRCNEEGWTPDNLKRIAAEYKRQEDYRIG